MLTRIITAIVALCVFVPICIFSDTIVLEIAMAVLNVTAIWEIWHCIRGDEKEKREGQCDDLFHYYYILRLNFAIIYFTTYFKVMSRANLIFLQAVPYFYPFPTILGVTFSLQIDYNYSVTKKRGKHGTYTYQ